MIKCLLKSIVPPIVLKCIRGSHYKMYGSYSSWKEARNKCSGSGYENELILKRVKQAAMKVKNGEAVFERDSVVFNKQQYSFPLLAALNHAIATNKGFLNVLDYGGSLGSSYFQNKYFLKIPKLNWCIVEQEHFVEEGIKNFADSNLHFFKDAGSCFEKYNINLVLLSGILQFIEHPHKLLDMLVEKQPSYIFIDRTPVFANDKDRITIQKVFSKICKAQYPSWIFNESNLLKSLLLNYDLLFDGVTSDFINIQHAAFKFYFFKIKTNT